MSTLWESVADYYLYSKANIFILHVHSTVVFYMLLPSGICIIRVKRLSIGGEREG